MKISDLGEFGLIQKIKEQTKRTSSAPLLGIGDDAAALRITSSRTLLATSDMLIEDVHFDLSNTDFTSLGWKSAAVNLSDIAAMGGAPRFCLTSLGLTSHITAKQIADFYQGFDRLAHMHDAMIVGGDTCHSPKGLVISVTVIGEVSLPKMLKRSGARPGDAIYVTGTLGDSSAGFYLLQQGVRGSRGRGTKGTATSGERRLIEHHLRPKPRVEWGRQLGASGCVSAMIDVSDGISSDLSHVCEQSNVGALIYAAAIPLSRALQQTAPRLQMPELSYALSGGEDYELLFTVPPARISLLRSLKLPLTEIGVVTREKTLQIVDSSGRTKPLVPSGYDHFKRRTRPAKKQS